MGLTRETFKHAAIYGSSGALGKLVGFLMLPVYAHLLGTAGYGVIGMIGASLSFVASMMGYSLAAGIVRNYHREKEPQSRKNVITTGVLLASVAALLVAAVGMLAGRPLGAILLGDASHYPLLCLALIGFVFDVSGQAASTVLVVRQRSVVYSAVAVVRVVGGVSLNIWLIVVLQMGLLGYFIAALSVSVLSALLFLTLCVRECGLTFDRRIARQLAAFQLPLLPASILAWFGRQIETMIVRFEVGVGGVGILAMGQKFPSLVRILVVQSFLQSWNTKRTELAESDPQAASITIGKMFSRYLFVLLLAALVLAVNIDILLRLVAPSEFSPAARIAKLHLASLLVVASSQYLFFGIYFAQATKLLSLIQGATTVLKVVLSYLLVSLWGLDGAALAGCVTAVVSLCWGFPQAQQRFRLTLELRHIVRLVGAAVVLYVAIDHLVGPLLAAWLPVLKNGWIDETRAAQIVQLALRTLLCTPFLLLAPMVMPGLSARAHSGWRLVSSLLPRLR